MLHRTDDVRIKWTKVVLPPVFLEEEIVPLENPQRSERTQIILLS